MVQRMSEHKPSGPVIVLAIVVVAAIAIAVRTPQEYTPTQETATERPVAYRVTGANGATTAHLTYSGGEGSTSQLENVALPWVHSLRNAQSGLFLYVSAQNGSPQGCVTTAIEVGVETLKTATSCGAHVIATASDVLK